MKEICLVFEAFLVFVFPSPDITNCYKLFMESNSIFELSTMHSTPRLTRQMPQHELRPEPDLTLLWNILTSFRCGKTCPRAPGLFVRSLGGENRLMHPLLSDFFKKSRKHMRPNSSFACNKTEATLGLELFFKTTVMWQDQSNENILNECFVNVIMAVERWWTSPEVHYKRYKKLYEK